MNAEEIEMLRKIIREEFNRQYPFPHLNQDELNQIQSCLHDGLPKDSIHMISCPCPRCSPRY